MGHTRVFALAMRPHGDLLWSSEPDEAAMQRVIDDPSRVYESQKLRGAFPVFVVALGSDFSEEAILVMVKDQHLREVGGSGYFSQALDCAA